MLLPKAIKLGRKVNLRTIYRKVVLVKVYSSGIIYICSNWMQPVHKDWLVVLYSWTDSSIVIIEYQVEVVHIPVF